ncbi:MAG TPA: hypothetical protein ENK89_04020 [Desulfobulbaceae bacterium]|nr:hypothetical protein [Desulfobulbaceae bacterium]
MKGMQKIIVLAVVGVSLVISGCGNKEKSAVIAKNPDIVLSCIGVLPVTVKVDNAQSDQAVANGKELQDGVLVMDKLLQKQFMAREDIRFISSAQMNGLEEGDTEDALSTARKAAGFLSCNGILQVTLHRYRQRVGGKYTASVPASVAFSYRLIDVNSTTVLCSGRFDETQQSVMANLYTFNSARKRGFTWITAEELAREGMQEKFHECPYLQQPGD